MNQSKQSKRRRWFQFSLRTLFVLMTILAVWLGLVMGKARKLRRAVDAITAAGGEVYFHHQSQDAEAPAPGPPWLRRLVGDEPFIAPARVVLTGPDVTDEFIAEHLRSMSSLEDLGIVSPNVTDAALTHIGSMRDLHYLTLECPRLTDAALTHVGRQRELYHLLLRCPLITDAGLPSIATLPKLGVLELNSPRVTASGIHQLESLELLEFVRSYRDRDNLRVVEWMLYPMTDADFTDVPLTDVVDELVDTHELPFNIDDLPHAKKQAPVTLTLEDEPFRDVLDAILEPHDLGYYFDRGAIRITSREEAEGKHVGEAAFRSTFPNLHRAWVDW